MMQDKFEIIRQNWNERTPIHAASDFYNVSGFKAGKITLTEIERREMGSVEGKTLAAPAMSLRHGYHVVGAARCDCDGRGHIR